MIVNYIIIYHYLYHYHYHYNNKLLGKGGQGLKDLMSQYGLKVYIEKDIIDGENRNVIISGGDATQRALCQERILAMSHDPQYFNTTMTDSQGISNTNNDDFEA